MVKEKQPRIIGLRIEYPNTKSYKTVIPRIIPEMIVDISKRYKFAMTYDNFYYPVSLGQLLCMLTVTDYQDFISVGLDGNGQIMKSISDTEFGVTKECRIVRYVLENIIQRYKCQ